MTKLFVYGTLKKGYINNPLLVKNGARFVQNAQVPDHGVHSWFPAARPAPGVTLNGEIWDHITTELWELLDKLEHSYTRQETFTVDGHKVMLYLYKGSYPVVSEWPGDQ